MMTNPREIVLELRTLTLKLSEEGWDRLRAVRLLHFLKQAAEWVEKNHWDEALGRIQSIIHIFTEFFLHPPSSERLESAISAIHALMNHLEEGPSAEQVDEALLPQHPEEWMFVWLGENKDAYSSLLAILGRLGFQLAEAQTLEEVARYAKNPKALFVSSTQWLIDAYDHVPVLKKANPHFVLIALSDHADFESQIKIKQNGARFLLKTPVEVSRFIAELAGLAWMPRIPYRVMIVDDNQSVLDYQTTLLKHDGFDVFAANDAITAYQALEHFQPEVCILDVEMPYCRGTDLASVFRQEKQFAQLPIIYLSAFSDLEHQVAARHSGGEDYLLKPVDPRLLQVATMERARQYRLQKTTERQRRDAWRHLESLKNALDVHALVSVTSADGTIIEANSKFCEVSGYNWEELNGRNHRLVKSGHHPRSFFESMWETISSGHIWQGEVQNRKKDGSLYWVKNTILPILDEHHLPQQYISIRTDITEQKETQHEREQQGRLLELLRNALIHFIKDQDLAKTAALLLDGMLLLTESESGFVGEVVVDEAGQKQLKQHHSTYMKWEEEVETAVRDLLENEHTLLQPAFLGMPVYQENNFIGVVGLFNPAESYTQQSVEWIRPFLSTYATVLQHAKETDYQSQIIEELTHAREQAEYALVEKFKSLRTLGHDLRNEINTIYGTAQLLFYTAEVDEETKKALQDIITGCEQFLVLLKTINEGAPTKNAPVPRVPVLTQSAHPPQQSQPASQTSIPQLEHGHPHRILVAEDNRTNQVVLKMQLKTLGFEADIAEDGAIALDKWKKGGHHLILADRNMPNMDGLELARCIRAAEAENGYHIPIIAITASQDPQELEVCRAAGMDEALPKPIDLNDLRLLLERWLIHRQPSTATLPPAQLSGLQQETHSASILDIHALSRTVGCVTSEQAHDLVALFISTAQTDLAECVPYLENQDRHNLGLMMHKLKAGAKMVGAGRFAHLAETVELTVRTQAFEHVTGLMQELNQALEDVEKAAERLNGESPLEENVEGVACALVLNESVRPDTVLVVDDDAVTRQQIWLLLSSLGIRHIILAETVERALMEIERSELGIDLLMSDLNMPGVDGIEFLRQLADISYKGGLILSSSVEDRVLETAAELAKAKGLMLWGTLRKPMGRDAFLALLTSRPVKTAPAKPQGQVPIRVSPEMILSGIQNEEFTIHFQPKVDAATLRPVGVEALARWIHQGTFIPPDLFITAAEEHDLIVPLSRILVTEAMKGGTELMKAGFPLNVAVNLSASWLGDVHLPEFILETLEKTKFNAEHLVLEITETGVMADLATALDVMTRLRLKGFKLSIDDFGTGYSSMEQLQRMPFGELKLDRSFVQGAAEKPATRTILASSIEMAMKLNLITVAEGVETQEDVDLVRGLGCNLLQGWFIAKAMPVDKLIEWLQNNKK